MLPHASCMVSAKETFRKAKAAARMALDLDSGCAEAHGRLRTFSPSTDWDWECLERDFNYPLTSSPPFDRRLLDG